jgi:hypothetical protein
VIIENRAGELHVVDQAARNGNQLLETVTERERDTLIVAPTMIIGAASQVGNLQKAGILQFVGMLYERWGTLCAPLSADSYIMATTTNESFVEVMQTLQHSLPSVLQRQHFRPEPLAIASAIEADQAVRSFFGNTRLCEPSNVHMEDAILNAGTHSWQVSGTYRPTHAVRGKRYYIELDARTGAVIKFQART